MIVDFTFDANLRAAVGRAARVATVVGSLVWLASWVLAMLQVAGVKTDMSVTQRTIMIGVFSIPAAVYVASLYLFFSSAGRAATGARATVLAVFMTLLLLAPAGHVAWRFTHVWTAPLFLTVETLVVLGMIGSYFRLGDDFLSTAVGQLVLPVKLVRLLLWDLWGPQRYELESTADVARLLLEGSPSPKRIASIRRPSYTDEGALTVFERSHSCAVADSRVAAELICNRLQRRDGLSVLDLGGGTGRFTKRLLAGLQQRGRQIASLEMIDPAVGLHRLFKEQVSSVLEPDRIRLSTDPLEVVTTSRLIYDVVVASHSLYGPIDNQRAAGSSTALERLADWSRDGSLVVILASKLATSYRFKDDALRVTLGTAPDDATHELFMDLAGTSRLLSSRTLDVVTVDNVMDLTLPLTEYDSGSAGTLKSWLAYFLRLPRDMFTAKTTATLAELLKAYACPFSSLAESVKVKATSDPELALAPESIVLTHKTVVAAWGPG